MSSARQQVLSFFAKVVRSARTLPSDIAARLIAEARSEIRKQAPSASTPTDASKLIAEGMSRLSVVMMMSPRRRAASAVGSGKFVVRDGKLVEKSEEEGASSNSVRTASLDNTITHDQIKRHKQLVERQHFGNYKRFV